MSSPRNSVLFACLAFVVGVVIGGLLVVVARDDAAPVVEPAEMETAVEALHSSEDSAAAPEVAPDEPPRERRRAAQPGSQPVATADEPPQPLTVESVGGGVTQEEMEFLRNALARERERRAQLLRDEVALARELEHLTHEDGLVLMDRYLNEGADVSEIVSTHAAMRAHIHTIPGPVQRIESEGDETVVDLTEVAEGKAVLEFGAGDFVLKRGSTSWNVRRDDVASLEIRGAGMDETRLVGPGWAFLCANKEGRIRNLVVRDLTLDSLEDEQIVLDARGGISAAFERVRVDGWVVAGHAAAFGVSGNAFLTARDCEFLGDGWVLSLRGPGLAVFERCTFRDSRAVLVASASRKRSPSVVRLNDCDFGNVPLCDRELRYGEKGGANVTVRGGTADGGPASWTKAKRWKQFGADQAVSMEGLTFVATPPAFSVADAARAMDLAARDGIGKVVALHVRDMRHGAVEVDFYVLDDEDDAALPIRHTRVYHATNALTEPENAPDRPERGAEHVTRAEYAGCLSVARLVRDADIAEDEEIRRVMLRPMGRAVGADGAPRRMMLTIQVEDNAQVILDPTTGKLLSRH